jgi:hypothetical protein
MARRIREEIIDDDPVVVREVAPVTRRIVTERRTTGGVGYGFNPAMLLVAAVLLVFILLLVFGRLV